MCDASEVIAEMRSLADAEGSHAVTKAQVRLWADRLEAASTPPGDVEAEARRLFELNSAGWKVQAGWDELHPQTRELWHAHALKRMASTPQPASDDPCVRHACKRVRMEMQARIDALSGVDDAMVERALAATARPSFTCLTHENYVRAILDAAIKGDSHAG